MAAMNQYTAVVKQEGEWWIGWVQEVPGVNAQESSREALLAALKTVLQEALEMNRADARAAAGSSFEELALASAGLLRTSGFDRLSSTGLGRKSLQHQRLLPLPSPP